MTAPQEILVFIEREPMLGVELLDLIETYRLVCYGEEALPGQLAADWGKVSHFRRDSAQATRAGRASEALADAVFGDTPPGDRLPIRLLFAETNAQMDRFVTTAGLPTALPPYALQARLGDKRQLPRLCRRLDLPCAPSLLFDTRPADLAAAYTRCVRVLGSPFVVQGPDGRAGRDTVLIRSAPALQRAAGLLGRGFRAARYLPHNIPLSVHLCILDEETLIRGPYLQLSGLPELARHPFRFAGNDTNPSLLSEPTIAEVRRACAVIADVMKAEGYRGVAGVDLLWDRDSGTPVVQEINARAVALSRLLTGMQKDQGLVPDLLRHIEAFTDPVYTPRHGRLRPGELDLSARAYSQAYVYNTASAAVTVSGRLEPGIHSWRDGTLKKTSSSLFVQDMGEDDVLVTEAAPAGSWRNPDGILARIILKRSLLADDAYRLEPDAAALVGHIRRRLVGEA